MFGSRTATLSPGFTPASRSPAAQRRASVQSSR
ncbi:hypothetical protein STANM309S_03581 [Streptomyces tanashiensis]